MTLTISGSSDDLVHIGDEEYNWSKGDYFHIYMDGVAVLEVFPVYRGYWAFAVGTLKGEDYDEWPREIKQERCWGEPCAYSEVVFLDSERPLTVKHIQA